MPLRCNGFEVIYPKKMLIYFKQIDLILNLLSEAKWPIIKYSYPDDDGNNSNCMDRMTVEVWL